MARLREFDVDEVMEAVINAFWERGYKATSLADLMAATGLQKGSIYKAFGDKRSLFLKALQSYLNRFYSLASETLSTSPPEAAIAAWFQCLSGASENLNGCKGCFAVNSLTEMAPHDPDVAKMLDYLYHRIGKLLENTITRGQKSGAFRTDLSAQQLRQLLIVVVNGTLASNRATFLREDVAVAMTSLSAVLRR